MTFNAKSITAESSATFEKAASGSAINFLTLTGEDAPSAQDFVASLPDEVQKYVQQATAIPHNTRESSDPVSGAGAGASASASEDTVTTDQERIDNFEICTRSHVLQLVQSILEANAIMDLAVLEESVEEILGFIRGIIDFCLFVGHSAEQQKKKIATNERDNGNGNGNDNDNGGDDGNVKANQMHRQMCSMDSAQFRKLPFLLMEDTVDTLPTSVIQVIWKYGPATWLQTLLCSSSSPVSLFHQGSKYCLIRMCNRLLKNLSVDAHDDQVGGAQFAGEISMILASVFPLSERSAVNVLGAFHVDNVVEFETLDEWLSCHKNDGKNNVGRNMNPTPNSNASPNNAGAVGTNLNRVALNYDFYSKFWGLQKLFTDPKDLVPKATAAPASKIASPWNDNMERFFSNLEHVLEVLEGHAFSADLIKHLSARWNAMKRSKVTKSLQMEAISKTISDFVTATDGGGEDTDVVMEDVEKVSAISNKTSKDNDPAAAKRQYKYLTNSQLLHLQLQDPEIRIHFISQVFILSSFLSTTLTNYVSTRAGSTIPNKMLCEKMQSRIYQLEKRAGELLRHTPPNGEVHLNTLQWILSDRESVWRNWKKKKCTPPIEKFRVNTSAPNDGKNSGGNGVDLAAKRRRLMGGPLISGGASEKKTMQVKSTKYTYKIDMRKNLPGISTNMVKHSGIDQFLEEYADALDPEAGIEEEYHPKRNKLSSWRALRSLTRRYIGRFGNTDDGCSMIEKKTGDFEGIVRAVWKDEKGVDIPGEMPKAEEISDDEVQYESEEEDGDENDDEVKEEKSASNTGIGADTEVEGDDEVGEAEKDAEMSEPEEKKDPEDSNGKGNDADVVKESVSKDEGEINDETNVDVKDSKSDATYEKQVEQRAKTPDTKSFDRKVDVQPSKNGKGTHTKFSTPAVKERVEHTRTSQNGHGTHVFFSTPAEKEDSDKGKPVENDSTVSSNNSSDKPAKSEVNSGSKPTVNGGQRRDTKGGERSSNAKKEGENQADEMRSNDDQVHKDDTRHQLNDRKRKHFDRNRDYDRDAKAKRVDDTIEETEKKNDPNKNDTKNDTRSSRPADHASTRGNYPRRNNSYPKRSNDQRQQESRQHNSQQPQTQSHQNIQQHRRGDSSAQNVQQHRRGESGGQNPSQSQQHPRQMRRTPPIGHNDNRPAGGNHGVHTRFTSPPPNAVTHSSGPPKRDDRGGSRGDDRGGPRGDDRGGPRGDDRGGPRGDDRGGPRGRDRGGPRGGDRGGPRGDDRGGPRNDDRGGPRGGRGQFDRRRNTDSSGRGGGGQRRRRH